MPLEVKIFDTTYTFNNEEKKCLFCQHEDEQTKFRNESYDACAWGYPDYHPCKGCKDFSKWTPTKRHLFEIIQFLQKKTYELEKKTSYPNGDCSI